MPISKPAIKPVLSTRIPTKSRNSPEVEKLVAESLALAASGSKVEDNFWEKKIFERLNRLLSNQNQAVLDAALDQTFKSQTAAFEILADAIETASESLVYEFEGKYYEVLLLAIPMIAQTRYVIPSGPIRTGLIAETVEYLKEFIFTKQIHLSIVPWLYSIDQIPQSYSQTRMLLEKMAKSAVEQSDVLYQLKEMPETVPVLADPRFILCAVASEIGQPLFIWQAEEPIRLERSLALKQWQESMHSVMSELLPGCEFDILLPDAFFTNCREADKRVRPLSLMAAVNYLESKLGVTPQEISCVVAPFGHEITDEFRISFAIKGHPDIIYGVVWPLYDRETVSMDDIENGGSGNTTIELISDTLHLAGVGDVFKHAMLFAPEMCEDCGVPLFPNRSAEVVHAEMPEDTPAQHLLFH
jgi:hypothetical protein